MERHGTNTIQQKKIQKLSCSLLIPGTKDNLTPFVTLSPDSNLCTSGQAAITIDEVTEKVGEILLEIGKDNTKLEYFVRSILKGYCATT